MINRNKKKKFVPPNLTALEDQINILNYIKDDFEKIAEKENELYTCVSNEEYSQNDKTVSTKERIEIIIKELLDSCENKKNNLNNYINISNDIINKNNNIFEEEKKEMEITVVKKNEEIDLLNEKIKIVEKYNQDINNAIINIFHYFELFLKNKMNIGLNLNMEIDILKKGVKQSEIKKNNKEVIDTNQTTANIKKKYVNDYDSNNDHFIKQFYLYMDEYHKQVENFKIFKKKNEFGSTNNSDNSNKMKNIILDENTNNDINQVRIYEQYVKIEENNGNDQCENFVNQKKMQDKKSNEEESTDEEEESTDEEEESTDEGEESTDVGEESTDEEEESTDEGEKSMGDDDDDDDDEDDDDGDDDDDDDEDEDDDDGDDDEEYQNERSCTDVTEIVKLTYNNTNKENFLETKQKISLNDEYKLSFLKKKKKNEENNIIKDVNNSNKNFIDFDCNYNEKTENTIIRRNSKLSILDDKEILNNFSSETYKKILADNINVLAKKLNNVEYDYLSYFEKKLNEA
ncbi:conserved protein, unknown function [Hepatocystis sp. ex Piliocolobus tephrosceles]|nr:conserved protein, unknown function [Hepatocystis sp. ex Piliocolobus tephrosceles]